MSLVGVDLHSIPVELNLTSNTEVTLTHSRLTPAFDPEGIIPNNTGFDNTKSPPSVVNYDVAFLSRGIASTTNVYVNYRSVEIPTNIDPNNPLVIPNFFQNITKGLRLTVIPRETSGDKVIYDVFNISDTQGGGNFSLTIFTLEKPPGRFPTPPTGDAEADEVIRRSKDGNSLYDIFYI